MVEPAPFGHRNRGRPVHGWLWLLAIVFTIAAIGSLALVVVDLLIGRSVAGDLFIAFLNAVAAAVLWREVFRQAHT